MVTVDKRQIHPEKSDGKSKGNAQTVTTLWGGKTIVNGNPGSLRYRLFYQSESGKDISPWLDVPLLNNKEQRILNLVCLTPAGIWAEHETSIDEPLNPIKVTKNGDFPSHFQEECKSWSLGFLPQTWAITENAALSERKGAPLEVLILKSASDETGSVIPVKILGAFAVRDKKQQLKWKLLGVNSVTNNVSSSFKSLEDISSHNPLLIAEAREWLRTCHAATLEEQSKFANSERPMGEDWAMRVVSEAHANFRFITKDRDISGDNRWGNFSWVPPPCDHPRTAQEYAALWHRFTKDDSSESIPLKRPSISSKVHLDLAWVATSARSGSEILSSEDETEKVPKFEMSSSTENSPCSEMKMDPKPEPRPETRSPRSPKLPEVLERQNSISSPGKSSGKLMRFLNGLKSTFGYKSNQKSPKFKLSGDGSTHGPGLTGLSFNFPSGVLTPKSRIDHWADQGGRQSGSPTGGDGNVSPSQALTPSIRRHRRASQNIPGTAEDSPVNSWHCVEGSPLNPLIRQGSLPTDYSENGTQETTKQALARTAQSGPMKPVGIVQLKLPATADARKAKFRQQYRHKSGGDDTEGTEGNERLEEVSPGTLLGEEVPRRAGKSAEFPSETVHSRPSVLNSKKSRAVPREVPKRAETEVDKSAMAALADGQSVDLLLPSASLSESSHISILKSSNSYRPPKIPVKIPPRGAKLLASKSSKDRKVSFLFEKSSSEGYEENKVVVFRRSSTDTSLDREEGEDVCGKSREGSGRVKEVEGEPVLVGGSGVLEPSSVSSFSKSDQLSSIEMGTRSTPMIARSFDWKDRDFGRSRRPADRLAKSAIVGRGRIKGAVLAATAE